MRTLQLIGAYGRKAIKEDWDNGLDFKIIEGPYCSKDDMEVMKKEGYGRITFFEYTIIGHIASFEIIL